MTQQLNKVLSFSKSLIDLQDINFNYGYLHLDAKLYTKTKSNRFYNQCRYLSFIFIIITRRYFTDNIINRN